VSAFVVGQRFVSEAEPELGLGRVARVENRRVVVVFPASDTVRQYASGSAPIRRAVFRVGDELEDFGGRPFRVEGVEERDGLLVYVGSARRVSESELSGNLGFSKPEDRLLARIWDESSTFDLRRRALEHRFAICKSEARGFLGGRIELLPHQLYIAREIAGRARPRALLADEVGLGKTIEAGLVIHRLLRSGQMARVLVLVPEPLVHQWFVEMFRRFHLSFTIVDEQFCRETEAEQGANPFLHAQTAIASLEYLAHHSGRGEQAKAAGWDMIVVDEAHHLVWSSEAPSPAYRLVDALAREAPGVLLLTATPEQLGEEGHFARLRLLDRERYPGLTSFRDDRRRYRQVADVAARLLDGSELTGEDRRALNSIVPRRAKRLRALVAGTLEGEESPRSALLDALVDQHGPGRVVFRNARKVLDRFPERRLCKWRLDWPSEPGRQFEQLAREFRADTAEEPEAPSCDYRDDVRLFWLSELLRELAPEKVLVICRFKEKAIALHEALRQSTTVPAALFHEDLSLLQRDRNAAWFADERDGAQVLLCSEIGSEGRNFQFAHHLVLFDLPLSPELLEQRIGRLYRIGQEHTVRIHVPYLPGSSQEMELLWYDEGLGAFETSLPGTSAFDAHALRLREMALSHLETFDGSQIPSLSDRFRDHVQETNRLRQEVSHELEQGRDRLLELSSFRPRVSDSLLAEIRKWDSDTTLDSFVGDALDYLGVDLEEIAPRTFVFRQGAKLVVDALPGLRADEVGMTSDRDKATHQGELDLLTWDHPMVNGVLELLLGGEHGNSAVAVVESPPASARPPLLEALFVLDTVAPPELVVSRFLPPTPLRVVVDAELEDVTEVWTVARLARSTDGRKALRFRDLTLFEEAVPRMIEKARARAERQAPGQIRASVLEMRRKLSLEIERLRSLSEVNDHVGAHEITRLERNEERLGAAIESARLRLDSLRLILVESRN
jgi:ATP-dependent helicase HepA